MHFVNVFSELLELGEKADFERALSTGVEEDLEGHETELHDKNAAASADMQSVSSTHRALSAKDLLRSFFPFFACVSLCVFFILVVSMLRTE